LAELRGRITKWAEAVDFSTRPDPEIPDEFGDREGDISLPLLAIAGLAGGIWPDLMREALLQLFASNETESTSGMLLAAMRTIFTQTGASKLPSSDICDHLGKMEEQPWPELNNGKVITPPQLARLLKPFGIKPRDIRLDSKAGIKGYQRADFVDAWLRYLPPEADEEGPDATT
jgi:hypothetical protein